MLISALSFIFTLGVLIFIHELGHFLVAKKVGIRVDKFSLGFPPTIFSKTVGETEYALGLIPLGGFVKMAGENPDEEVTGSDDEFASKTVGQRAAVVIAGPFMNYALAIIISIGLSFFVGIPFFDDEKVVVGQVFEGKPAYEAGLRTDDIILALDGVPLTSYDTLRLSIWAHKHDPVELTWARGIDTITAMITPEVVGRTNESGEIDSIGMIGFGQKVERIDRYEIGGSIVAGVNRAHGYFYMTIQFVKKIIFGEVSRKGVGGPVAIFQMTGQAASAGVEVLFDFMALLSVNLAVLNVLPIPVLDGGHLVFLLIEKIKGSPLTLKSRLVAQQVGMLLLLTLIVFVTYNDIMRVITG